MSKKFRLKKFIATVLTAALLFQTAPLTPSVHAVNVGHANLGTVKLDCLSDVAYRFDSKTGLHTYDLELTLNGEFYDHMINTDSSTPARGYFTVRYDGWYLVELWGADGGNGPDDGARLGGIGGAGGYVYGKVYLKAGQTLYYSLGGDGSYTYTTGAGGGANGGGHGGSNMTFGVGGGGGYSAIFLFPETEGENTFEKVYLDGAGNLVGDNISPHDRETKYLMIAGGGGGGGAGEASSVNSGGTRRANGGSGGNLETSIPWEITGEGLVQGTCFAGEDGQHTGDSDEYIGLGGDYTPGAVVGTAWNWSTGQQPNNWIGSYNTNLPGGAGGAGNLRGGAGGAGFCGGSGGIQQSLVSATQIGGGGGGSSFVAATANNYPIYITQGDDAITDREFAVLDRVNDEAGCTGGRVAITYLVLDHEADDFAKTRNLDVSFAIAPYFDVQNLTFTGMELGSNGKPTFADVAYDLDSRVLTLKDVSLSPKAGNLSGDLKIQMTLTPRIAFPGGNDVPLLRDGKLTVTAVDPTTKQPVLVDGQPVKCDVPLSEDYCHVNVPLKLTVPTRNLTFTNPGTDGWSVEITPGMLYNADDHDATQLLVGTDTMYAFIEQISDCSVVGLTNAGEKISDTKAYEVGYTVDVKNDTTINPAAGPENPDQVWISGESTVNIRSPHDGVIHGQKMTFTKDLTDNKDGTFTLSLHTQADNRVTSQRPEALYHTENGRAGTEVPIEHTGIYLLQAWGGKGSNGTQASSLGSLLVGSALGGDGGEGGYSYLYLPLTAGDTLYIDQMGDHTGAVQNGRGGDGGTYTAIRVVYADPNKGEETLLIAGGGGGGGNGAVGGWLNLGFSKEDGGDGGSARKNTPTDDLLDMDLYNGEQGYPGTNSSTPEAGDGGKAGENYYNSDAGYIEYDDSVFKPHDHDGDDNTAEKDFTEAEFIEYISDTGNPNTVKEGGGAFRLRCMWLDHHHITEMTGYTLKFQLSDYFVVEGTDGKWEVAGVNNKNATTLTTTGVSFEDQLLTVTGIAPSGYTEETRVDDVVTETYKAIDFTISIKIEPRDGFLGGNHVPVLAHSATLPTSGGRLYQYVEGEGFGEGWADIEDMERTDYANVPLAVTQGKLGTLEAHDVLIAMNQPDKTVWRSQLFTWSERWTPPGGWVDDYVIGFDTVVNHHEPDVPVTWESKVHTSNAHYDVTVGVAPTNAAKAQIVGTPAVPVTLETQRANVYVQHRMLYLLNGVEANHDMGPDHCESLNPNQDFTITLTPLPGYKLPSDIDIYYHAVDAEGKPVLDGEGNPVLAGEVPHSFDTATGKVTILSSNISGNMTLTATGQKLSYNLYFGYEVQGSHDPVIHTVPLTYGADVAVHAATWEADFRPAQELPGYTFRWEWRTGADTPEASDDGVIPATMPAQDVWVIGVYTPKTYQLNVRYLKDADSSVISTAYGPAAITFGSAFHVDSPAVDGFYADFPVITGTMNAGLIGGTVDPDIYPADRPQPTLDVTGSDITFTVRYKAKDNQLRIEYTYQDSYKVDVDTYVYANEADCLVTYRQQEGYSLHLWDEGQGKYSDAELLDTAFSGKMDGNGIEIRLQYRPRQYTLYLYYNQDDDTSPGVCTGTNPRVVTYNSTYEYRVDPIKGVVDDPLPTKALRAGYEFRGWELLDEHGNPTGEHIAAATEVKTARDHTLVAIWEAVDYTLEVHHVYLDGSRAAPTEIYTLAFDSAYGSYCQPKEIHGFNAYIRSGDTYVLASKNPVSDSARLPAHSVVYTFYYIGIPCELTIEYRFAQGGGTAYTTYRDTLAYGASYLVKSPQLKDVGGKPYVCSQLEVSGTMDDLSGKHHVVYYYTDEPVFTVTIDFGPSGDKTYTMQYDYNWGTWIPERHTYVNGEFKPKVTDANRITVTNDGSKMGPLAESPPLNIDASLTYVPNGDYPQIGGHFTGTGAWNDATHITGLWGIQNGAENKRSAWLWLTGQLPTTVKGVLPMGQCIVSITAAGGGSSP